MIPRYVRFVKYFLKYFLDIARFLRYSIRKEVIGMNNRIKEFRTVHLKEKTGKKLTQKDFADRLGLSENFIWQIEKGERIPSDRTISDICREFGCNEAWLRTGDGDPFSVDPRKDQIMRFATQTVKGSDEFKKSFVAMLAQLDASDWENLAKLFDKLSGECEKK